MKEKEIARKRCANYVTINRKGYCFGVMMSHKGGALTQWIDSDYANKPCVASSCNYFDTIVVPGVK